MKIYRLRNILQGIYVIVQCVKKIIELIHKRKKKSKNTYKKKINNFNDKKKV